VNTVIDHRPEGKFVKDESGREHRIELISSYLLEELDEELIFLYVPEAPEMTGYYERVQCVAYANTTLEAINGPYKTLAAYLMLR
jgi:hypothetical protein